MNGDEPDPEFYSTIQGFIEVMLDDIVELTGLDRDDPRWTTASDAITILERAVRHLRGFLRTDGTRPTDHEVDACQT
jgi:hypothetical protein